MTNVSLRDKCETEKKQTFFVSRQMVNIHHFSFRQSRAVMIILLSLQLVIGLGRVGGSSLVSSSKLMQIIPT